MDGHAPSRGKGTFDDDDDALPADDDALPADDDALPADDDTLPADDDALPAVDDAVAMASSRAEADGLVRMAQAFVDSGNPEQARDTCQQGLTQFPGNPGLTSILESLSQSQSQHYRVERPVLLTPSLDPVVAGGTPLEPGALIEVLDVVVFKGVTRMRARAGSTTGWLDLRGGAGQNVVKHPHGPSDPAVSAQQAKRDCVMSAELEKKGRVFWGKRFFVIGPARLTPARPDRYLYYFENNASPSPKDTILIETCRASPCQEKAHSLHIAVGQHRDNKPDQYIVAADSAGVINGFRAMLDKMIAGMSSVPSAFQQHEDVPLPIEQLEAQPEPEPVALPPEDRRPSWVINADLVAAATPEAEAPPLVKPAAGGFEYLFEVENRIIEERRQREEAIRQQQAEEAARQAEIERRERERREAEEEAARLAAEEQRRMQEEAERLEQERLAQEREERSVGKWLAEECGAGFAEGGAAFRALYEQKFADQDIHELAQLRSMAPDAVQVVLEQVIPTDLEEHRDLIKSPLEEFWAAEQAEFERRERERIAAEEAEAARQAEFERRERERIAAEEAEAARQAEFERRERERREAQEAEAARQAEFERRERERRETEEEAARLAAEEVHARTARLRRKIDNLRATNSALEREPGAAAMVESNRLEIARYEAEIANISAPVQLPRPVREAPALEIAPEAREMIDTLTRRAEQLEGTISMLSTQGQNTLVLEGDLQNLRQQIEQAQNGVGGMPTGDLGGPPPYQAPTHVDAGSGAVGDSAPPPYEPPAVDDSRPPQYQQAVYQAPPPPVPSPVPSPAPAGLTSQEQTVQMLGAEQVTQAGSMGLSVDMLSRRLAQYGVQITREDMIRVVGAFHTSCSPEWVIF